MEPNGTIENKFTWNYKVICKYVRTEKLKVEIFVRQAWAEMGQALQISFSGFSLVELVWWTCRFDSYDLVWYIWFFTFQNFAWQIQFCRYGFVGQKIFGLDMPMS